MRDAFLTLHLTRFSPQFQPRTGRVASAKLRWVNTHQITGVINSFWVALIHVLNKKALEGRCCGDTHLGD